MGVIIAEITVVALLMAFLGFLAWDDNKNRKLRAEEDRQKALEERSQANASSPTEKN